MTEAQAEIAKVTADAPGASAYGAAMKLIQGQYVRHSKYGWGTILEYQPQHTTVYFRNVGVRKLTVSEAVFQVVEDPVALKRRRS